MSDLVGNPKDRFSHNEAQMLCVCSSREIDSISTAYVDSYSIIMLEAKRKSQYTWVYMFL